MIDISANTLRLAFDEFKVRDCVSRPWMELGTNSTICFGRKIFSCTRTPAGASTRYSLGTAVMMAAIQMDWSAREKLESLIYAHLSALLLNLRLYYESGPLMFHGFIKMYTF